MAVPATLTLYLNNDQYIEVDGLADAITLAAIDNATVTCSLYDSTNAPVASIQNVPLTYLSATAGNYRGQITHTMSAGLTLGASYTMYIDVNPTTGTQLHIEIKTTVAVRKS